MNQIKNISIVLLILIFARCSQNLNSKYMKQGNEYSESKNIIKRENINN